MDRRSVIRGIVAAPAIVAAASLVPMNARMLVPRLADCKEVMAATYDLLHKLRCFISDKDEVHEEIGWVLMRLNDVGKLGRPDPERDAGDPRTPEFGVAP